MEAKLTELVKRLKSTAGDNLKAVVLYGSAVSGEFQAAHSDLNVLCIVDRAAAADLERLHPVADWWLKERNPAPLIFTMEEAWALGGRLRHRTRGHQAPPSHAPRHRLP